MRAEQLRRYGFATATSSIVLGLALALLGGCGGGGGGGSHNNPADAFFQVSDDSGAAVAGATVYLVPATAIDESPITNADLLNGSAEDRDEPLEDPIRLHGSTFPQGITDANGRAVITAVPAGEYFWFVSPGMGDTEHLPGGSGCRNARSTTTFLGLTVDISLTSQPSSTATFKGSSTCLVCHSSYVTQKTHAHRLGFTRPGNFGALQDASRYPEFTGGWDRFLPAATFNGGTRIYCSDYDGMRGFDKFKTSLTNPAPAQTVYLNAWLWKDNADGKYKITLQNVINPADPGSPRTFEVPLTYGGAVFKQRNLVKVPGRRGLYPMLQWQPEGSEGRFDRTRKVFRDYHLDLFWNSANNTLTNPPVNSNFDANCTACHATGFSRFFDSNTGEWLTDAVDDVSGEYDIDQNGSPDEINNGCETCHGPGSDHETWAANPAHAGHQRRYIVQPKRLSPEREVMICARCHGRVVGHGTIANEEPLDTQNRMAPVGISRQAFLANYTTQKGPAASDMWSDGLHSKNQHQQANDLVASLMHRNDQIMVTCSDCHDAHGFAPYQHHLTGDPTDPASSLCLRCHAVDVIPHMIEKTGATHGGSSTQCVFCHMSKTAQTGAGHYGFVLGTPSGTVGDNLITYYENDLASHLFQVPRKDNPSVAHIQPAFAMPIPYTKSCGALCHDPSQLQNLTISFVNQQAGGNRSGPVLAPGCTGAPAQGSKEK